MIEIVAMTPIPIRLRGTVQPQSLELDEPSATALVDLLKAVADPTRLHMLAILAGCRSPVCVCDLTATFRLSQPTISHHMGKLRRAGLVSSTKIGIWAYYEIRPDARLTVRSILELA
jgi:ArsR family transcriptional regulator, arsenate/arsenite/antimonite-responsive transcriptional repressor